MTDKEKAIVMAYTGVTMLAGDKFSIFHKYIEELMEKPVYTHELLFLKDELKARSAKDFIELCKDEPDEISFLAKENKKLKEELKAYKEYRNYSLPIMQQFTEAGIITGGRLNGKTWAYKCGLKNMKEKMIDKIKQAREEMYKKHQEVLSKYEWSNLNISLEILDKLIAESEGVNE